ncbi:hypothetical protein CCGE525_27070 (plasmid) [Rhizobium jaguaris]|uniref:NUDIX domain-containing protein n=2 Tax=Rhizobium jaguaris TaxID=1312183 RepID=A0A387G355_9HYPH|nr:hypothetical protein CCGE525_27070 [Rhizobium jaguaris]
MGAGARTANGAFRKKTYFRNSLVADIDCLLKVAEMNTWRQSPQIRIKALGLHWRDGRVLAAEVYDDQERVVGVRPLDGSVEFGERSDAALQREFKEELDVEVKVLAGPLVIENLYLHEGESGHVVVFVFSSHR